MNKRSRAKRMDLIRQARDKPCVDCGRHFPPGYMHLDHTRGQKEFTLTQAAVAHNGIARVVAEIAKCDVRCPICHHARHQGDDWQAVWEGR